MRDYFTQGWTYNTILQRRYRSTEVNKRCCSCMNNYTKRPPKLLIDPNILESVVKWALKILLTIKLQELMKCQQKCLEQKSPIFSACWPFHEISDYQPLNIYYVKIQYLDSSTIHGVYIYYFGKPKFKILQNYAANILPVIGKQIWKQLRSENWKRSSSSLVSNKAVLKKLQLPLRTAEFVW